MNIVLTPELNQFVSQKVAKGDYDSAEDVVGEALRLLEERDHDREERLAAFNAELARRLAVADAGTLIDGEGALARMEAVLS